MIKITGGVISKHKGNSVTFIPKCEKCGNVDTVENTVTLTKGVTEVSTKRCSFCGNNQVIKMKLLVEEEA